MALTKLFHFNLLAKFKDRDFLVYREAKDDQKVYSYHNAIELSKTLRNILIELGMEKSRVTVQFPHSVELCIVLLSVLNCDSSFCPVPYDATEEEISEDIMRFGARFHISQVCLAEKQNFGRAKLIQKRTILKLDIFVYHLCYAEKNHKDSRPETECYCIKTSGSTGVPKIVRVPYQCIEPNITGLSERLKLVSEDLLLNSTPFTFDPFVVEYFLAMKNGAALLITNPLVRLNTDKLVEMMQPNSLPGATLVQMTPSLFRRFGETAIRNILLNETTTIRILLLGGERFPAVEEFDAWTANNKFRTRVFNIYGITEVSCWSTLHEIKGPQIEPFFPIGLPIDKETHIRVINEKNEVINEGFGEIHIGSAYRKCLIDDEVADDHSSGELLFRATGDIGYITQGDIFYEDRKNEIIKHFGHRIHKGRILRVILGIKGVLNACCLFDEKNNRLLCFILKSNHISKKEIQRNICSRLDKVENPDEVVFVDSFPLTSHGKICHSKLYALYESLAAAPDSIFERFVTNVLCLDFEESKNGSENAPQKKKRSFVDLSFIEAGGTSFQALSLATHIESSLKKPAPRLFEMMLDGATPISSILEFIRNLSHSEKKFIEKCETSPKIKNNLQIKWEINTGKCVDAAPNGYEDVVCVGSHSRLLLTVDSKTGHEVSRCFLPDRIECKVCFLNDHLLLVGCYDGYLYIIDYLLGKIEWKLNCEGMIKAQPLLCGNLAVVGNYSTTGNLVALNVNERLTVWKAQIGSKGIFASPLQLNNNCILACTLAGEIASVSLSSGHSNWITRLQSPIFSTPAPLTKHHILVAEVSGLIHCLNEDSGTEVWNFHTEGNIFSSIIMHSTLNARFILFGNHDKHLYCLKSNQSDQKPSMHWRTSFGSAIYSTPAIFDLPNDVLGVVTCSTKGGIFVVDFLTGLVLLTSNLGNEIFSSPCIKENRIYVGCRNNNLVCLELPYETQMNNKEE